jgi:hypothetical protein
MKQIGTSILEYLTFRMGENITFQNGSAFLMFLSHLEEFYPPVTLSHPSILSADHRDPCACHFCRIPARCAYQFCIQISDGDNVHNHASTLITLT